MTIEYRPDADPAQPSPDVAAFRAMGVSEQPGIITISGKAVKFNGEELSQLGSLDAIVTAIERNRG